MQKLKFLNRIISFKCNKMEFSDLFANMKLAPADPILGVSVAYKADTSPSKMDLGVGAYRDENEKPYVFDAVRKAENDIISEKMNKEYLPVEGLASFNTLSQQLLFGEDCPLVKEGKICTVQALSGTGALRIGMEFLANHCPGDVLVSNPTWSNHMSIVVKSGLKYSEYPYFYPPTKGLDYEGILKTLSNAKEGTIVLLHVCAHNPTGVDPTEEQWKGIAKIMKERKLLPFFDSAYQGYASGDLEKDVTSIRVFINEGFQFLVAQGFAKNFGLYGERIGALHIVCRSKESANVVLSQIKLNIRPMYSNPPLHGARIISKILGNPIYRQAWKVK